MDIAAYVPRTPGTWSSTQATLEVPVDIWPSSFALDADPCGATKHLFVITGGGGGYETTRLWFQRRAVEFTKTCTGQ